MVKVPGARLLIGRAAVRSESVGVEGPAWWVKHFKPLLNWWIWDPTHSSTLHPLYLTLCIPYCPHLPHSDPLSNGCHKTYSVPWLATLPEQNFQCLSVCMRVRECVAVCVQLIEPPHYLSGVEMRHKGAGRRDSLLPVFLQRLYMIALSLQDLLF